VIRIADQLKDDQSQPVRIVTIGLGQNVNDTLLRTIATSADDYHYSPSPEALEAIYTSIAWTLICADELQGEGRISLPQR
jgi:hypothetical protein